MVSLTCAGWYVLDVRQKPAIHQLVNLEPRPTVGTRRFLLGDPPLDAPPTAELRAGRAHLWILGFLEADVTIEHLLQLLIGDDLFLGRLLLTKSEMGQVRVGGPYLLAWSCLR